MKRTYLIVLSLLFGSLVFGQTPNKIPLEKAIAEGLNRDYEYLNTLLDQEKAGLQQQLSAKKKMFRLDFDASYLYRSETMVIDFPSVQIPGMGVLPGKEIEAGLNHNFDFKLSLSQPLFTGGILSSSVKLEEVQKAIQLNQKALKEIEIAGRIKSSYFQYLLLSRRRESLLTLKKTLDLHCRRIENFLAERMVRRTDLLETLSRIEEIQLNINDLDRAIQAEKIHFHRICGYYPEEIDDTFREQSLSQDSALSYFEQNHPVLKTLQNQADILTLQRKIASGKYLPQVSGFAEVHYGKPGIDFFAKKWSLYVQGGIILSIPVFDWNRLRGEKTLLDLQQQKLENQRKQFAQEVTKSLEQLYTSLRLLEDKKAHIDLLMSYSREDADLKAALYSERQIPNVDYLTALLTREKNSLIKEEIQIQVETIKVNINTLIGKSKEDG